MARFKLFTTFYRSSDATRTEENQRCILKNLANPVFSEVHVLLDHGLECLEFVDGHSKLVQVRLGRRPKFSDIFSYVNQCSKHDDMNVVANTDIYFDEELRVLELVQDPGTVFALTRWDVQADGSARFFNRYNSQDSWVFKGQIRDVGGDYFIGTPGCDNRLVHELRTANYHVVNPAFSIKSFHLHQSMVRPYLNGEGPGAVRGPYGYVLPQTLLPHCLRGFYWLVSRKKYQLAICDTASYRVIRFDWYRRMYRTETSLSKRLEGFAGALFNFHYLTKLLGGRPPRSE
jgi:hypothetical protein